MREYCMTISLYIPEKNQTVQNIQNYINTLSYKIFQVIHVVLGVSKYSKITITRGFIK